MRNKHIVEVSPARTANMKTVNGTIAVAEAEAASTSHHSNAQLNGIIAHKTIGEKR